MVLFAIRGTRETGPPRRHFGRRVSAQAQHLLPLVRPGPNDLIGGQTNKGNTKSQYDTDTGSSRFLYRFQDELPQIRGADEGADYHHEHSENHGLIHTEHNVGESKRQLD